MNELDRMKAYIASHAIGWIVALAVVLLGVLVNKLARRWATAALRRSRINDDLLLKNFFLRSISLLIVIATLLIALSTAGVEVVSIVAGLGLTGLILGFGLRDTLANFASGLLLLIYRPFRAGDLIEVEMTRGVVEELTIVNMQMTTTDGVRVIMPNSKVWGSKITNYSVSKHRRLELTLKVREDDVEPAIDAVRVTLAGDPRVLDAPEPEVRLVSVADNAATLSIFLWTSPEDFRNVSADEYLRLSNQLRKAELQIL